MPVLHPPRHMIIIPHLTHLRKPIIQMPLPAAVALNLGPEQPIYGSAPNPFVSAACSWDSEYVFELLGLMPAALSQPHVGRFS